LGVESTSSVGADVDLSGNVAAASKLSTRDSAKAHGTLDIGPRIAVVCASIEPVAICSGSKGVEVPCRAGAKTEGDLVDVSYGSSQHRKARAEVGGVIDARVRAHIDCSGDFRVGDNIIDRGGAGESPACDEGLSIIRGDIKG
jgi:hypothetical protein